MAEYLLFIEEITSFWKDWTLVFEKWATKEVACLKIYGILQNYIKKTVST